MAQLSSSPDQFGRSKVNQVFKHFENNPFRFHFASWLFAAVPFAVLMLPELSVVCVIAFGISAIIVCTILSVVTYPLSGHYSFTIVGSLFGAAVWPLGALLGIFGPTNCQGVQIALVIGAIIGSTNVIWRIPLQMLDAIRKN